MVVLSAIILNEKKINKENKNNSELEEEKLQIKEKEKEKEKENNTMNITNIENYETKSSFSYHDIDSFERQIENKKNKKEEKEENEENEENEQNLENQNLSLANQISIFWSFLKTDKIYKPVIFIFLFMITPSYSDIMFFFYTNRLNFTPIAIGRLRLIYGFASIIGIYSYNNYLKDISFKKIIFFSTALSSLFSLSSLILVERINIKLGIPDFVFCMGADALNTALSEINMLPILVLACNICPKNIEGTLYAFLMSVINLSSLFASQIGSIISLYLGITSNNFENFRWFILIANFSSFLPLPLLFIINDNDYINNDNDNEKNSENNSLKENDIYLPKENIDEEEKNNLLNFGLKNYLENKNNNNNNNGNNIYINERHSHNNKNFDYEKILRKEKEKENNDI
jgi:hypothetical protein